MNQKLYTTYLIRYLRKLVIKFWILAVFIPSLLGVLGVYFGLPKIIFSWQLGLIFFLVLFFVANYTIWKEKEKEKEKLQDKIKEYENKRPKLNLTLGDNERHILVRNTKIIRKVKSSLLNNPLKSILKIPNFAGHLINPTMFPKELDHTEKEILREFIPLNFTLHNIGNVKAKNIRVEVEFPKESTIIEKLPSVEQFPVMSNYPKKTYGMQKTNKHKIILWDKESLPPEKTEFDDIFIHFEEEGIFKVKYTINAEGLLPNRNKGVLIIESLPKEETRLYAGKETLRQEKEAHEILLKKLEEDFE